MSIVTPLRARPGCLVPPSLLTAASFSLVAVEGGHLLAVHLCWHC